MKNPFNICDRWVFVVIYECNIHLIHSGHTDSSFTFLTKVMNVFFLQNFCFDILECFSVAGLDTGPPSLFTHSTVFIVMVASDAVSSRRGSLMVFWLKTAHELTIDAFKNRKAKAFCRVRIEYTFHKFIILFCKEKSMARYVFLFFTVPSL